MSTCNGTNSNSDCLTSSHADSLKNETTSSTASLKEMTSKYYYFDSYSHFGIHEVFVSIRIGKFYFTSLLGNA